MTRDRCLINVLGQRPRRTQKVEEIFFIPLVVLISAGPEGWMGFGQEESDGKKENQE